ncbi:MAG: EamA family transporter [Bacteroidota bacterium]
MARQQQILIILSFAAIYFIWGSTYLFVAFSVEEIPAFLMAATRFGLAATLLYLLIVVFRKQIKVSWTQFKNAALAGFLFLTMGIGCSTWALQYVDSGLTALLIAAQPLVIVLALWVLDRQRPSNQAFLGVFLGILGMYLLVSQDGIRFDANQITALFVILLGMTSWTIGSIYVGRVDMPSHQMTNNAIQMASGTFWLLLLSLLFESPLSFDWTSVSWFVWGSIAYLVVFGAVLAFMAFNYLLTKVSPEKVATGTYVNPIVALFLGWLFREEVITGQSLVAAGIMLMGVWFINSNRTKRLKIKEDETMLKTKSLDQNKD